MATTKAFAPAKINLTLHVTGQRSDGYHLLDSLVVFADVGDVLRFDPAAEMALSVTGPFSEGVPEDRRNLVWRAAEAAGWTGRITLHKALPHGAGIGGGSADAAAVLRYLNKPEPAASLGADVPVCLSGNPQRMRGIGDMLDVVPHVPHLDLVLVNAGGHVATPQVFGALANKNNQDMGDVPEWASKRAFIAWLAGQRNDLQSPACAVAPQIGAALGAVWDAELARMSGSGGTCFGLYPNSHDAARAAARIAADHPDWWVIATTTYGADT